MSGQQPSRSRPSAGISGTSRPGQRLQRRSDVDDVLELQRRQSKAQLLSYFQADLKDFVRAARIAPAVARTATKS